MAEITLITGGARSGKSSFALELALKGYSQRSFIATALAVDEEMKERIAFHQKQRGNAFQNVEAPIRLSEAIASAADKCEVAVVDCLTVWLGNLYHHYNEREASIREDVTGLLKTLDHTACDLILVTNEVGWGIVPERPLGRVFRDMAGFMNQQVAQRAHHVYLLCCGIPIALKGESARE
jgi:adenosylcobinamide kinase/adenosylcobinamide-phosphate guanylyltransferase